MTPAERKAASSEAFDRFVERVKLYAGTLVIVGGLVAGMSAVLVRSITAQVSTQVEATGSEFRRFAAEQRALALRDSVRFERVMDVIETAVVAIVEEPGSEQQRSAIAELRRRRHVIPRTGDTP